VAAAGDVMTRAKSTLLAGPQVVVCRSWHFGI
jgi:hypothetical protein